MDVPNLAPLASLAGADSLIGSHLLPRIVLGSTQSASWSVLDTETRSRSATLTDAIGTPTWSADGKSVLLAATAAGTPTLFRYSSNTWDRLTSLPSEAAAADGFQPRVGVRESVAGSIYALVVTLRDQSLHLRADDGWRRIGSWPIFAGTPDQKALAEAVRPASLTIRSDGKAIAAALERQIVVVDPATGATTAFAFEAVPEMIEFSPKGDWLAAAGAAGVVQLIDTATGKVVTLQSATHRSTDERIVSLFWAANERLVSVSNRELVVWDTNRLAEVMRTTVQSPIASTRVGPDRRPVMLYADGSVEWLEDRR
jgi:DNA-binding beta-propeller fold protein YncE